MLLEGQAAPRLPFLKQFHWIVTPDPTSEKDVARADRRRAIRQRCKSRRTVALHIALSRLSAVEEKDSYYFFGRERETVELYRSAIARRLNTIRVP
jgi:hypothetical protein